MITIHHLGVSQSERILWLMEELGLPYELIRYDRDPVTRLAPAAYKALTPFGTAPVIDDGDLRLGESGAIIEYVIFTYGDGRLAVPPSAPNYADYLFWWHFANGSLMPAAMGGLMANMLGGGDNPVMASLVARIDKAYAMIEDRLAQVPYFAGEELSAADLLMAFPLSTMRAFGGRDLAAYPHIRAYLQRIGSRPAYQRAMAKGDPGFQPLLA